MERLGVTVIGSGPAAVAAAYALVTQGRHVTMLDAGIELEPERQQFVEHMMALDYAEWDQRSLAMLRDGAGATASGVPIKRVYGSDFPYRGAAERLALELDHVTCFSSLAKGGLSNVWGSAVMPYRASDVSDWPVSARDGLVAGYEGIFEFLPLAAIRDDLASDFPLYTDRAQAFAPSPQATALLERMTRHRDQLRDHGITFGRSRLAVRVNQDASTAGCVYCGLCMYGCPRDLIYRSSQTLDALVRAGKVTYVQDVIVDHLAENEHTVYIRAHDRVSSQAGVIEADRVFVACGTLSTARLMLDSLPVRDATLTMRDSQYFLLPVAGLRGRRGVAHDRLHTLAQVFVEIEDTMLSARPMHLQVYTYNDLYTSAMKSVFGIAYPVVRPPANVLLNRLMVVQGYLHSSESSAGAISLDRGKLRVRRIENPGAARSVKAIARMLYRNRQLLGFSPLTPMLKIGDPGQGAHIGGTFPMCDMPGPFESDILGRPHGAQRIHLVDGSVLPSIPATTVTLSIMANAYRIAREGSRYV